MKRLASWTLALNLVAALAVPAWADSPTDANRPSPEAGGSTIGGSQPNSGSYRLRPEDVIEITVLGLPQLDKTLTILPDGTISYPRLGTVRVAGLTSEELRQYLYKGLDKFYNNLQINVGVKSLRTDWVTVNGAVKKPGNYAMRAGWTVRELLAAAEGIAALNGPPAPDQMRATLIRKNGQRIPIKLAQLMSEQGAPDLPALEPDDKLTVEDLTIQVSVDGQVNDPGKTVNLRPGATVLDALKEVRGHTDKAALSKAQIRRGTQIIPIDLRPFVEGKSGSAPPPALQRFDTLYIPENKNQYTVLGGVQRPGRFLVPEDETLSLAEAIAQAGGPVPRARLKEVDIVQRVDEKLVSKTINVEGMVRKGDFSRNILVQPGDIIYVPDPKLPRDRNWLSNILPALLLAF